MTPNGRTNTQKLLMREEGLKLKVYPDSQGILSIGWGRNLVAKGISTDEALFLLNNDISACIHDLNINLPWYVDLNEARQAAMISMTFNLGIHGFLGFHQSLDAIKNGNWQLAHDNILLSEASQQDKNRYVEIAEIFLTGELA